MKRFRAYKTELDPTRKQLADLLRHAGAARWTYNWGLQKKIEAYKATGKSPSAMDLHRELVLLKKKSEEDGGVPWMYALSKCAPQEALRNLDSAYEAFFRRCANGEKAKGFPRFKSRKNGVGRFRLNGVIRVGESHIQLPRIGILRLKERNYLPMVNVRILSASISEVAGRWFASLQVEEEVVEQAALVEHAIGIDVGIKVLAMTSDGVSYENHKALSNSLRLLRIRQKAVSRKKKGSANRTKAVQRVASLHRRIGNERKDSIHKATTAIIKQASVIVIESLNVAGMVKNRR
jgi:putative transposase